MVRGTGNWNMEDSGKSVCYLFIVGKGRSPIENMDTRKFLVKNLKQELSKVKMYLFIEEMGSFAF